MREFLYEISILGRLKHRNLVGLRGWCKKEKDMNARLGDFDLAKMHYNGEAVATTRVVGRVGVLIFEVLCGRRRIDEEKPPLVEWVWELMKRGDLMNAFDERLRAKATLQLLCFEEDQRKEYLDSIFHAKKFNTNTDGFLNK
ncbi:hypothetical protein M9H77_07433 [Catharanthus roseus]|uniref:Uncharacterized protein n=1 Tax=Catharanthus roseus TaxID=4058 RepID=A0ACC0BVB4_CATRO|nr:hypothetical protein M9H77_07433 [Catharanthus roseus]